MFHRSLSLLITILLLCGTIAAQETRQTQEETAKKLMLEGMQLVANASPASLTNAIEKFESARILLHSLNMAAGEAAMLSMIGYAYNQLEQNQKAIEKYEQSLPLFRAADEKKGEAASLLHLGLIHGTLGEMQKAFDNFDQALPLFRAAGDSPGEAFALSTMGSLHSSLGKYEESISYYNKALEIFRATGSREGEAVVLIGISPLYNMTGQPEKVRETLEQALSVCRAAGFRHGEALALLALGLYYSYSLDIQKALECYEQALPLTRAEHDRLSEGAALHGICMSYVSSRDYQKGFDYCAQSQALLRATGDRQTEAMTLKHIAIGERNRGNLAASQTAIESAIANIESVRTKVINPELRLSYFERSQDYYDLYIDVLMLLQKQYPNEGTMVRHSKRAKGRAPAPCLTRLTRRTQTYVKALMRHCCSASVKFNAGSTLELRPKCNCFRGRTQRHKPERWLKRSKRLSRTCSKSKRRSGKQVLIMRL